MTFPAPLPDTRTVAALGALDKAEAFRSASRSPATVRAYTSAWRGFTAWCERHGAAALPAQPGTVAAYLADRAAPSEGRALKPSSIWCHATAISKAHRLAGVPSPVRDERVRDVLAGIRRTLGVAPVQKKALTAAEVRRMVLAADDDLRGLRDRALVLLGFAAALRRSELVALQVAEIRETDAGLEVRIARSKTDQEGAGRLVGVCFGSDPRTCPVRALRAWQEAVGLEEGPVFRAVGTAGRLRNAALRPHAVPRILKSLAKQVGLDPATISGHSLRAGHATEAARNGASALAIRRQTGHRSDAMLARYVRVGTLFDENSSARLGL